MGVTGWRDGSDLSLFCFARLGIFCPAGIIPKLGYLQGLKSCLEESWLQEGPLCSWFWSEQDGRLLQSPAGNKFVELCLLMYFVYTPL